MIKEFSLECHTVSTEQQQAITKLQENHKTSKTQHLSKTTTKTQTNLLINLLAKQFGKKKCAPPIWGESAKMSN